LDNHELPSDVLPGVRRGEDGDALTYEERFTNTDETRRYYF
jgi:antirestriction protein ArdC